jgi:hypothetical protein
MNVRDPRLSLTHPDSHHCPERSKTFPRLSALPPPHFLQEASWLADGRHNCEVCSSIRYRHPLTDRERGWCFWPRVHKGWVLIAFFPRTAARCWGVGCVSRVNQPLLSLIHPFPELSQGPWGARWPTLLALMRNGSTMPPHSFVSRPARHGLQPRCLVFKDATRVIVSELRQTAACALAHVCTCSPRIRTAPFPCVLHRAGKVATRLQARISIGLVRRIADE